jgi:hypothetical protein
MLGHWHSEEEEEEEEKEKKKNKKKKDKKKKDKKKKKKNENKSGFPHRLRVGALRWEPADVGGVRRAPVARANRPATVGTVAREDMQRRRETRPAEKTTLFSQLSLCLSRACLGKKKKVCALQPNPDSAAAASVAPTVQGSTRPGSRRFYTKNGSKKGVFRTRCWSA